MRAIIVSGQPCRIMQATPQRKHTHFQTTLADKYHEQFSDLSTYIRRAFSQ
jgi:hypothetical protein